ESSQIVKLLLLFAAFMTLAGCSRSNMGVVIGRVTVDGEPAKVGAISFFAVDGRAPTAGAAIARGKCSPPGTPGLWLVQVRVSKVVGEKKMYDTPNSPVRKVWAEVLPAKFNDDTQLKLDVKRGENKQDYDLKTK